MIEFALSRKHQRDTTLKGIIALDIDGTITVDHHSIADQVVDFLEMLAQSGWCLFFITGRTFQWGYEVLQHLRCPFYFAVQNGAIVLEMPSRKIICKNYLDKQALSIMEMACRGEPSNFIVYTGYEYQDICFYRPHTFSPEMLQYILRRKETLKENWVAVEQFEERSLQEFASLKAFGTYDSVQRMIVRIEKESGLHAPFVMDPFQKGRYVVQVTHPHVNKGETVKDVKKILSPKAFVIAAGDDNNDKPMLVVADIKVVMATAPQDVLSMADIEAPSAEHMGIIQGISQAIAKSGL